MSEGAGIPVRTVTPPTHTGGGEPTEIINLDNRLGGANGKGVAFSEGDRLQFARRILSALLLVFLVTFLAYYVQPSNEAAKATFELVKIGVLPLVTLVIGFYFPNNSK